MNTLSSLAKFPSFTFKSFILIRANYDLPLLKYIIELLQPTSNFVLSIFFAILNLAFCCGRGGEDSTIADNRDAVSLVSFFGRFSSCFDSVHVPLRKDFLVLRLHMKQLGDCLLFQVEFHRISLFLKWKPATVLLIA